MDTDGIHANVATIVELETAYARFAGVLVEQLPEIDREIRQTLEALEDRSSELRNELATMQEGDSSDDEEESARQRQRIEELEAELASVQRRTRKLADAVETYRETARNVEELATTHTVRLREFLKGVTGDLQNYLLLSQNEPMGSAVRLTSQKASDNLHPANEYTAYLPNPDYKEPFSVVARSAASTGLQVNPAKLTVDGNDERKQLLRDGFNWLAKCEVGRQLICVLHALNVETRFGPDIENGTPYFGLFSRSKPPELPAITLGSNLASKHPAVIAAHLAHEATHAKWYRKGSIDQEFDAYETEAYVWSFLVASDSSLHMYDDDQLYGVCDMISAGKEEARVKIRDRYTNLPEHDNAT